MQITLLFSRRRGGADAGDRAFGGRPRIEFLMLGLLVPIRTVLSFFLGLELNEVRRETA